MSINTTCNTSSQFDMHSIKAFIFDMDGVIFDSEKVYYDAFFIAAQKHGIEASHDFVMQFSGKTSQSCQIMLQNYLNHDFDRMQTFWHDWGRARLEILTQHGLDFKTGFHELLDAITQAHYRTAIVTSADRADMEENFARNNVDPYSIFEHIITIEDVRHPKPHPEPYQIMMKTLNYAPEQCVVIEDSLSGVSAALAAGAQTIMINEHIEPAPEAQAKLLLHAPDHKNILAFLQQHGL